MIADAEVFKKKDDLHRERVEADSKTSLADAEVFKKKDDLHRERVEANSKTSPAVMQKKNFEISSISCQTF